MTRRIALATLLACLAAAVTPAPARTEPTAGDGAGLRVPSEPVMAPDGKRMLFTLTGQDDGTGVERARVWLLDPGGRRVLRRLGALLGGDPPERPAPRPLTRSDEDAGSPTFTPDGWGVSFLSARGEDARPQLWVLSLAGGEAERWTDAAGGVEQYAWAPDGSLVWRDGEDRSGGLWRVSPGTRTAERLSGEEHGVTGFALSWSGSRLAFTTAEGGLWTLDLDAGGGARPLLVRPGGVRSPRWSHDEALVYFLAASDPERPGSPDGVWSVPVAGGPAERVSPVRTSPVTEIATCAESDRVYLVVEDGANARPERIIPGSGRVQPLTEQPGRARDLAVRANGERAAFVWQAPETAPEIATWTFPDDYVEPLTELNADLTRAAPAEDGETP